MGTKDKNARKDIEKIDFISNEQLEEVLKETDLTPVQEAVVVDITILARLQALKISFLVLAGIAVLAIIPAGGLPGYTPGEVPDEELDPGEAKAGKA